MISFINFTSNNSKGVGQYTRPLLYCDNVMMMLTVIGCSAWCRDGVSILMPVVIRDVPVGLDPFGLGLYEISG